jgi:hypothetical protein
MQLKTPSIRMDRAINNTIPVNEYTGKEILAKNLALPIELFHMVVHAHR